MQRPYAWQEKLVTVPFYWKRLKVFNRLGRSTLPQPLVEPVPAKSLENLDIEQLRDMDVVLHDESLGRLPRSCPQNQIDNDRGIEDDHFRSRS